MELQPFSAPCKMQEQKNGEQVLCPSWATILLTT